MKELLEYALNIVRLLQFSGGQAAFTVTYVDGYPMGSIQYTEKVLNAYAINEYKIDTMPVNVNIPLMQDYQMASDLAEKIMGGLNDYDDLKVHYDGTFVVVVNRPDHRWEMTLVGQGITLPFALKDLWEKMNGH